MRNWLILSALWRLWDYVAYRTVHLLGGRFLSDEESQILEDARTFAEFLGSMCNKSALTITRREDHEWSVQVALQWINDSNKPGGTTKVKPSGVTRIGQTATGLFNRCKVKRREVCQ